MKLMPYRRYIASDVKWQKQIPENWRFERAKSVFRVLDVRSKRGVEKLLSVSERNGVAPRKDSNVTMFKAKTYVGHKLCWPNDLVINSLWAWMNGLGFSKDHGIVSTAYSVFRIKEKQAKLCFPEYLNYLLRSKAYSWEFRVRSKGIWRSRYQLLDETFLNMPILLPPFKEQEQIARFLAWQTAKINKFIKSKQKLISLLCEKRDYLTEKAVQSDMTNFFRLGSVSKLVKRPVVRKADEEYCPIGLYNRGRGIFHKKIVLGSELGDSDFFWLKKDDLVFSGQFAWEGAVAQACEEEEACIASHRYPILRGEPGIVCSEYLLALFKTKYGNMVLNLHSRGAAGRNRPLNASSLMKEKIPIPPLELQNEIAEIVQLEARLRKNVKELVMLLEEYKNQLISDVVTGKVDVRGIEIPEFENIEIAEEESDELEESEEATEEVGE